MKTYCASDLHLGYERTNYDMISAFFDLVQEDADELILCGDTFDLWRMPAEKIVYSKLLGLGDCLNQLDRLSIDVPVSILYGNHDYNLNLRTVHTGMAHLEKDFAHEGIFYTHGWQFDVLQRRYSWAYGWLVTQFPYLYQKYFKKPARMGMGKNDVLTPEIKGINTAARSYAKDHGYKFVVMGHTHMPGVFGQVVNCGDFVDSCSYVVIEDGKPKIEYL